MNTSMKIETRTKGSRAKVMLPMLILLALLPFVFGSYTGAWGEYQDAPDNTGFVHDEEGYFGTTETTTICSMTKGMNYQALTGNFDSDDDLEFVIFRSGSIQVYNNDCSIDYEVNIGTNIATQPVLWNETAVTFLSTDNNISIYTLNGSIGEVPTSIKVLSLL